MVSKQDRVRPRTVEDLERKYDFDRKFSQQQQQTSGKGQDGLTPYIGANGNWWIGNADTGVNASGTPISFTPTLTEGVKIGTLTIGDVNIDLYAPYIVGYNELEGEHFLQVGDTRVMESKLQALLMLLEQE